MSTRVDLKRRRLAATLALAPAAARAKREPATLRIGLVPYLSTRATVDLYQPLRAHLEARLGRPTTLFTASDFRGLADNARAGEYALTLMPAHLARIAVLDWGHVFVARTALMSEAQLIARRGAEPALPAGLRGARIAAIDPLSIVTLALQRWLERHGLRPGEDVTIDYRRSIGSAAIAVQRGEAVALVGAIGQLRDLAVGETASLVKIATLAEIPTPVFVAHPAVDAQEIDALRRALLGFVPPADADPGLSRARFVDGSIRDLDGIEHFAQAARTLLAAAREPRRTGTPGTPNP